MTEIFIEKNHAHLLRNKSLLQLPKARTVQFGIESIAFLGAKLWHGLSNDIKESLNVSVFKKHIKKMERRRLRMPIVQDIRSTGWVLELI